MTDILTTNSLVELWGGWWIELPPSSYQRNEDLSWSAWGEDWAVDVTIIEVSGKANGDPVPDEELLGQCDPKARISGAGWIGSFNLLTEKDGGQDVIRLATRLCSENTLMLCWVSYFRDEQRSFARKLIDAVIHWKS